MEKRCLADFTPPSAGCNGCNGRVGGGKRCLADFTPLSVGCNGCNGQVGVKKGVLVKGGTERSERRELLSLRLLFTFARANSTPPRKECAPRPQERTGLCLALACLIALTTLRFAHAHTRVQHARSARTGAASPTVLQLAELRGDPPQLSTSVTPPHPSAVHVGNAISGNHCTRPNLGSYPLAHRRAPTAAPPRRQGRLHLPQLTLGSRADLLEVPCTCGRLTPCIHVWVILVQVKP